MIDIEKILREAATDIGIDISSIELMAAADEIERLREEIEKLHGAFLYEYPVRYIKGDLAIADDRISELETENIKLRNALKECAQDLEAEINARYHDCNGKVHPALQRKYDNDMSTVIAATKVIEETGDEWEACRGIAPDATGEMSSEEFIRKERDEW